MKYHARDWSVEGWDSQNLDCGTIPHDSGCLKLLSHDGWEAGEASFQQVQTLCILSMMSSFFKLEYYG